MIPLSDIGYGGESIKGSNVTQAYINSYSPYYYLELSDLMTFKDKLLSAGSPDIECHEHEYLHCYSTTKECEDLYQFMKPLSFKLDSTTYTVQPEGYTVSNSETTGYKCMIFVSAKFDSQGVDLGTLFLTNFVMSYDYSNNAVRLGVNTNAPEGTTMVTDSPEPDPDDGKK